MKKIVFTIIAVILIILGLCYFHENLIVEEYTNVIQDNNTIDSNDFNTAENNEISKEDIKFDQNKMKSDSRYVVYNEDDRERGTAGIQIELKNGKPYLSTDVNSDEFKFLFPDIVEPIKDKEITGFNGNVIDTFFAFMGNGDMTPIILFLMEDGSVEFANSAKMINFENYKSFGKVEELSNIVKFVNLDVNDIDENGELLGGFITVAAIDKDGYSFDLSSSKTIQEDMLSSTR